MLAGSKTHLTSSLLDRLIDEEPEKQREKNASHHYQLAQLCESVRRDLENLLNTRKRCLSWPVGLTELKPSLIDYGIPDFMSNNLSTELSQKKFCESLKEIILQYEPRFKSVYVSLVSNEQQDRILHLKIEGIVYAEPTPETIIFSSILESETQSFVIIDSNIN